MVPLRAQAEFPKIRLFADVFVGLQSRLERNRPLGDSLVQQGRLSGTGEVMSSVEKQMTPSRLCPAADCGSPVPCQVGSEVPIYR